VHTRDVVVEALGTTFNVQAIPGESRTEISLMEGKVRVSRENPSTGKLQHVVLTPGHKATFLPSEERFVLDRIQASGGIPWTQAPIVLDDQRLDKIADLISGRYNVVVQFIDEDIRDLRLSMQIDDESLEEILTIISKVLFLEYEINDQVVSIKSSNSGNQE
jgi:ferric-dicitrate binding protein FerR (iron transport regulator)